MKFILQFACFLPFAAQAQPVVFQPHRDVAGTQGSVAVVVADFDRDDKPDMIVIFDDGHMGFFKGDGKGAFSNPVTIGTIPTVPLFLASADLNGDGIIDLIAANPSTTYVLLGHGDGKFTLSGKTVPSYPLLVADVNGDGIPDILQWAITGPDCSSFGLFTLYGTGNGEFRDPNLPCIKPTDGFLSQNYVGGDLFSDGKFSFAWSGSRTDNYVGIFPGSGDGTFRRPHSLGLSSYDDYSWARSLAVGDFHGNGRLDLVSAISGGLTLFSQSPDKSFPDLFGLDLVVPRMAGSHYVINGLFARDFDHDGKLDLAWGHSILSGNANGTFKAPVVLQGPTPDIALQAAVDLNGDGLLDLISFYYDGSSVRAKVAGITVFLNNGAAPATAQIAYSAASGAASVAPGSAASIFGTKLARGTAVANTASLQLQLGGISVRTRDSANTVRLAPLYYVSPAQINFLLPADIAPGLMTLTIDDGSASVAEAANATLVFTIAPGFFVQNGLPAATAIRVLTPNTVEPVPVIACASPGACSAVPIDLTRGAVYLTVYGTGFRNVLPVDQARPPRVSCRVGGLNATVTFAGSQPTMQGLDQLNLILPPNLPHGAATVECIFSGAETTPNPVQVLIQ